MKKLLIALTLLASISTLASEIKYYVTEIENTNVVLPINYDSKLEYEAELRVGNVVFANQKLLSDYQTNKVTLNHRNGLANFCFEYTIYQGVLVNYKRIEFDSCDQIDIKNLVQKNDVDKIYKFKSTQSLYTVAERRGLADICFGDIRYSSLTVANIRLPDNKCD